MKLIIILAISLAVLCMLSDYAEAQGAGRGIGTEESCHNFSHEDWLPVVKICRTCHTPHENRRGKKKKNRYAEGLRWNRSITSHSFSLYNSLWSTSLSGLRDPTWTAPFIERRGGMPDGLSKLCLGCHDGIIAPNVFDLHHFVSMDYDATRTELRDPHVKEMGVSGPIEEILDNGKVQCFSCHDPHDEEAVGGTKLLRVPKHEICFVCHRR
jgi:predicted CXXCH cytochrome family protein